MTPLLSTPLLRAQSDRRLTALAGDGHDRAFEEIVDRYRRPLQRYLRRLLSEPLAEDVLQATFVRAWQALRAGTEVRDLRPWLYRIAHNQALNALRVAGSALPEGPGLSATSTEVEVERREELRATLDGIGALPDRQRAALLAVAVADRPHADVARELGLSDGALRQLLLRARTALRAAATAITPYPMVTWLAGGQDVSAARVAEVAAGAGGAGVAIKAGAAVLAAGALVAGAPALRDEQAAPAAKHAPTAHHHKRAAPSPEPGVTQVAAQRPNAQLVSDHVPRAAAASHRGHSDSGDDDGSTHRHSTSSGPGPSGSSGSEGSGSDDSRRSGSDASVSGSSDSGHKGDDDATVEHVSTGSSGPGPAPAATLVPEGTTQQATTETDDHSGAGSGADGSGGDDGSGGGGHSGSD
jgi:RNA polymerase sigma factor (sigma-70 family)